MIVCLFQVLWDHLILFLSEFHFWNYISLFVCISHKTEIISLNRTIWTKFVTSNIYKKIIRVQFFKGKINSLTVHHLSSTWTIHNITIMDFGILNYFIQLQSFRTLVQLKALMVLPFFILLSKAED